MPFKFAHAKIQKAHQPRRRRKKKNEVSRAIIMNEPVMYVHECVYKVCLVI